MQRDHAVSLGLALVVCLGATAITAQAQQGRAPRPAARARASARPLSVALAADSVAEHGDTASALRMLDSAVRADRLDAAAWHRRGLIWWSMAKSKRSAGIMPGETIRQLMRADTSLRMAHLVAPDSVRYGLDLANFQLESKFGITRHAASFALRDAVEAMERVPTDSALGGATAAQMAALHWRRYQQFAHRLKWNIGRETDAPTLDAMGADPRELYDWVTGNSQPLDGHDTRIAGEPDYVQADRMAMRAVELSPRDSLARRLLFAILAERGRWEELAAYAARARRVAPTAPMPLLAHGLALHELGRRVEAEVAFDSALLALPDSERTRLASLTRLLRSRPARRGEPSDSARYASYSGEERALTDSMYWALADPLSLTPENEFRAEFRARVAFAEIVWTSEEMNVRGADSERGDIYIRYGPPSRRNTVVRGELWRYPGRLAFVFINSPMFGTARLGQFSATRAELLRADQPATFAYTPLARRVDSARVQVARFRVDASRIDSADVFVTGALPLDSMLRDLDVRRTTVDVSFGVWTGEGRRLAQQLARVPVTVGAEQVNLPRLRTWRQRLPMGEMVYRVEAAQYDGLRGARGRGLLVLAPAPAFGSSDLLVAAGAAPRPGVAPRRWSDLAIAPSAGVIARGAPLALVWETYGLAGDSSGATRYRVTVAVQRRNANKLTDLAARIVAGIVPGGAESATALRFERTGGAVPSVVQWLTLDLGNAGAGEYVARVTVEDLVAGEQATVTRAFRIE